MLVPGLMVIAAFLAVYGVYSMMEGNSLLGALATGVYGLLAGICGHLNEYGERGWIFGLLVGGGLYAVIWAVYAVAHWCASGDEPKC